MIRIKLLVSGMATLVIMLFGTAQVLAAAGPETGQPQAAPPSSSSSTSTGSDSQVFGACAQAPDSPVCKSQGTTNNPVTHIINVTATIVASITGIAAVVMIILGGLSYISAGGSVEQAAKARRQIAYSAVGLVVVALAWAITVFITDNVIH